jgi:outer membrane receptor protein involved in Fe transport
MTGLENAVRTLVQLGLMVPICLHNPVQAEDPTIEDILVITQKREQRLQDVPVSVSTLSTKEIRDAGIHDFFHVAELVPSLQVFQNSGPINTSFRIRRIGNEANIPNFEPAVGLFIDEAYRARSGVGIADLFDIDRIEVLRGPQSTLYGKNTTAGLIHVITRKPSDEFELFGELTGGRIEGAETADMTRIEGAVSGPITPTLAGRLSGAYFDHDPLMTNLLNGDHSQDMTRNAVRGQLLVTPHEDLEARLIVGRFEVDSARSGDPEIDEGVAVTAINEAFGVSCPANDNDDRKFCANRAGIVDLEANNVTLNIRYSANHLTLTSITGYEDYETTRDFDADQLNIDLVDVFDRQSSESLTQELRFASPADGITSWLAGIYYYRNDFERGDSTIPTAILGLAAPLVQFPTGIPFGEPGDSGFFYSETETTHLSIFGNLEWRFREKLALAIGARWLEEEKDTRIANAADHSRPTLITLALSPPSANTELSRDTDDWTWQLSGWYQWSPDLMTYVSASKGFKSGGFNAGFGNTPAEDREFDDESVISYEIGAKTTMLDGRIRLNAALFSAEYDDYQSAGFVGLRFVVNNAEEVNVSGFEADLNAQLTDGLSARIGVSYADAEYDTYSGGSCHFGRVPDNVDGSACILSGSQLPLAPEWITSTSLQYVLPVAIGDVYTRLDWTWVDDYFTNATLDPRHQQDSYSLVNLRGGLRFGALDLSLWFHNVGDETWVLQDGATNLFPGDPAFGRFLGSPRSYGLTLRAQW